MNKPPIILFLMLTLVLSMGCAKKDWIQDILVTVDVSGMWRSTEGGFMELELKQEGARVKGSIVMSGLGILNSTKGPIDGTVEGDVFRFRQTTGAGLEGETTVSGDEMSGRVRSSFLGAGLPTSRSIILRRIDSSAPPRSQ